MLLENNLLLMSSDTHKATHEITVFMSSKSPVIGYSTATNGSKNGDLVPDSLGGTHVYSLCNDKGRIHLRCREFQDG